MSEREALDLMCEVIENCGRWERAADCESCPLCEHAENCHEWLFDAVRRAHG